MISADSTVVDNDICMSQSLYTYGGNVPHAHKATAFHLQISLPRHKFRLSTFLTSNRGLTLFEADAFVVVAAAGGSTSIGVDILRQCLGSEEIAIPILTG
jgi:hypothetical protein